MDSIERHTTWGPSFSHEMIQKLIAQGFSKEVLAKKMDCHVKAINNILKNNEKNLPLTDFGRILTLYCKYCLLENDGAIQGPEYP